MRPSVYSIRKKTMAIESKAFLLADDGVFPNNHRLPLLVYCQALKLPGRDPAAVCEDRMHAHRED